ncbi:L-aminopeptidase/D-esterase-like protein [Arthrobacter sp. UYCu512]
MGYAATADAAGRTEGHAVERGNVGAGTGALIGRGTYKGGIGTASITLENGVVVGALAVVNALGLPYEGSGAITDRQAKATAAPPLNTTLAVVATNAVLDKAECKRTASAAHAGLARALYPSHTLADGDTVFCLATGALSLDRSSEAARQGSLISLQSAAADVVRLAILDGIASARAVSTPAGHFGAYGR